MDEIPRIRLASLFVLVIVIMALTVFVFSKKGEETYVSSQSFMPVQVDEKKAQKTLSEYIEIKDSCGVHFEGACLNVRAGPTIDSEIVMKLRNGIVLRVEKEVIISGQKWYKISFDDEWLRYEDRLSKDWYISAKYVNTFFDKGPEEVPANMIATASSKLIIIDRSSQKLYAYENKKLFMEENVSTGLDLTPTPRGVFHIYKKTPSRYMQGPIDGISEEYYDLPGVPWNLYFTEQGAVIHGAYWHDEFGQQHSNGCVNLPPTIAKRLYYWADLGTEVVVKD